MLVKRVWTRFRKWVYKRRYPLLILTIVLGYWYYNCLPDKIFNDPTSTVVYDFEGEILNARIADDGQWRFPHNPVVPEKFEKAIIQFEDCNFYSHIGISARGIGRAIKQNFSRGSVVSGGSTITMQVIRLMRKGKKRTYYEKLVEMIQSTRLELRYSKKEILALYASNAPMGGNVVGIDAAAWRYFGSTPDELSWAEAATLAVLPNAPSHIFPGKNQAKLLNKRNRLLKKLQEVGDIDSTTYLLAISEPLPIAPPELPQLATHLTDRLIGTGKKGERIYTTINKKYQEQINHILEFHHQRLMEDEIYNAACLVMEVNSGEVIAYTGNVFNEDEEHGSSVDIIPAPRSTGSILKPFLYAALLEDGMMLPEELVPDIPTHISGYTPKNYSQRYDGAVPANKALARSLNVPAVKMLQQYGNVKFHYLLKKLGMTTLNFPSSHYGLSLVLGGAEANLWDLASIYAKMARILNQYPDYQPNINQNANYLKNIELFKPTTTSTTEPVFNPATCWFTFQAMLDVARPDEEANWQNFYSSSKIAWKTGTSFGFRDAWAIGITPQYVVAVWCGNADGEGRPGLVGIQAAAPILFDVFSRLPKSSWFKKPYDEMIKVAVCKKSGFKASMNCESADTTWIPASCNATSICPYHQLVHLDAQKKFRVDANCEQPDRMLHEKWFVLPPIIEYYYKSKNPGYVDLPPYRADCIAQKEELNMELIYPKKPSKIFIPIELDGQRGKTIFEVTHRNPNIEIHWHLDDVYLGSTKNFHQMEVAPGAGKHRLTIIDENGEKISQQFEIIER